MNRVNFAAQDSSSDVSDSEFQAAVARTTAMRSMRQSVSAEVFDFNAPSYFVPPHYPKTPEQMSRIQAAMAKSFLFSAISGHEMNLIINAFSEHRVNAGDVVIQQNEAGDCLFLIESGEYDVYKSVNRAPASYLITLSNGEAFGELALLYNTPRAATIKAKTNGLLWRLDRQSFNQLVGKAAALKRQRYGDFINNIELLHEMDSYEKSKLCDALKPVFFAEGDVVIREGEPGDRFYIVESGTAVARKMDRVVKDYQTGDYFGELALLTDAPRATTITATSKLTLLSLDAASFKRLLGPLEDILRRHSERYQNVMNRLSISSPNGNQ